MRRLVTASVATLAVAACVPRTDDRDPRGAGGVETEPSPGTLGEPFLTDDGWTVRVETLYVRAQLTVEPERQGKDGYARARSFLWNARERRELYVRGLPEGSATTSLRLRTGFLVSDETETLDAFVEALEVPPEIVRRFTRPADGAHLGVQGTDEAPSMLLVARGEREGRSVSLDLTLDASGVTSSMQGRVAVVADELRLVPHPVAVEQVFAIGDGGRRAFQPIADADDAGDGDGRVTGRELSAASRPCEAPGRLDAGGEGCEVSLLEVLKRRAPAVVGSRSLVE